MLLSTQLVILASLICLSMCVNFPLKTSSRWIVDSSGQRVKLACVNWYGTDQKDYVVGGLQASNITQISSLIKQYGFNCVRLPWSNEMYEKNPVLMNRTVIAKEPKLYGKNALDVLDLVIEALGRQGLMVILDNHVSDANWCCSNSDQNGLWYNQRYSQQQWLEDWRGIVGRYKSSPHVIGADLRNELRMSCDFSNGCRTPVWGGGDPLLDWHQAAQLGGEAVLSVNPNILIIVEGLNYALDLHGVYNNPIKLSIPNRLVYEAHDYSWDDGISSCSQLNTALGDSWGYILEQGKEYTAPVWLGEFGTCHKSESCVSGNPSDPNGGFWFSCLMAYMKNADIDWSFWALDGTQSTADGRTWGAEEGYGILNMQWDAPASVALLSALQSMQNKTQGP